jgi:hypothetical protein
MGEDSATFVGVCFVLGGIVAAFWVKEYSIATAARRASAAWNVANWIWQNLQCAAHHLSFTYRT